MNAKEREASTTTHVKPATEEMLNVWATDLHGPVALHLRQTLIPAEGRDAVLFPPTYAGSRKGEKSDYNIDEIGDGRLVATIDSVGSQANRMEPLFKEKPFSELVPQINIRVNDKKVVLIFDVGHRLADALVRNTDRSEDVKEAFKAWLGGDGSPLAKLAPTSIVFGAWDSRDSGAKLPRIVQSVVRAWDVQRLTRSAQYMPPLDYAELDVLTEEEKAKAEGSRENPLAQLGFVHVPSTGPGGIIARGPIYRDVTVNLVALRRIPSPGKRDALRKYILGLSLVAATHGSETFLRQGCLLTLDPEHPSSWEIVGRDGSRSPVALDEKVVLDYAKAVASSFGVGPKQAFQFDPKKAKEDRSKDKGKGTKTPKEKAEEARVTVDGA